MKSIKVIFAFGIMFPFTAGAESYATINSFTLNYTYSESYEIQGSCYTKEQPIYGNQINV